MSVFIRGMKMPQSCDECWFRAGAWCSAIEDWQKAYNTPPKGERLEECPLVELPSHGRLIDADALKVSLTFSEKTAELTVPAFRAVLMVIDEMPTIIEAKES